MIESAAAPVVFVLVAVAARLAEHVVLDEVPARHDLTGSGRALVELLNAVGQLMIVAAGVSLGILWAAR